MKYEDRNIDITRNIKVIEWLKSELLNSLASLFELLVKGIKNSQDAALDILANMVLTTYLLSKRLGISFEKLDLKIRDKAKLGVVEDHSIEKWYGDLSDLIDYLNRTRG